MDNAIENEVMNVDEVAVFLRINRKTVYEAVAARKIPHQRLGRRILFSKSALLQWLTGRVGETATTTAARREHPRVEPQPQPRPSRAVYDRIVPVPGRQRTSAQIEALKTVVLQAVKDEPLKGVEHYAKIFGITTYMIGQILGRLVADGLLSRTGHARAAIYRPL
jgi:excisionase family DNA binding protein